MNGNVLRPNPRGTGGGPPDGRYNKGRGAGTETRPINSRIVRGKPNNDLSAFDTPEGMQHNDEQPAEAQDRSWPVTSPPMGHSPRLCGNASATVSGTITRTAGESDQSGSSTGTMQDSAINLQTVRRDDLEHTSTLISVASLLTPHGRVSELDPGDLTSTATMASYGYSQHGNGVSKGPTILHSNPIFGTELYRLTRQDFEEYNVT